ncbi:ATP synthase F1 subunit epsilon [Candidatus Roizmanbacteria bacterium RIFCSPLOWO2_01_FULL_44_13]|uniref:ATP synthase epsilon chain n=1 Tax=Candidatus Roizmanbacteria bacterium RIFCSPLOWO2_01_FULL_44_13 TaxID=1802069 RepID=A0A1F7JAB5_9BACT|nr:MAG: ATP synthase F1 subunit epsilon [Candidatus Roizmanbacteria bacterium RIFCSPLOWO2_01_FULL_44_13]
MDTLKLKIITPKKVVKEEEVFSVTVPTSQGEITILPRHVNLFSLLVEGIVKVKKEKGEELLGIGGGYVQTDGEKIVVLVSRAYGQSEIDENLIKEAVEEAKNIIKTSKNEAEKNQALATLRRAVVDSKLLKRKKHKLV